MDVLLDKSVLRFLGISSVPPSSHDESRAHNVTFGGPVGRMVASGSTTEEETSGEPEGADARPAKRLRSVPAAGNVSPVQRGAGAASVGRQDATTGSAPSDIAGFRRTCQKKVSHGPRGARRLGACMENPVEARSSESDEGNDGPGAVKAEGEIGLQAPGTALQTIPSAALGETGGHLDCEAGSSRATPTRGPPKKKKLIKRSLALGMSGSDELDEAVRELSIKEAELDDWRREMKVKEQTIMELKASSAKMSSEIRELRLKLSDGGRASSSLGKVHAGKIYEERDLAVAQVALEKQIASHARAQLEQELINSRQLSAECARLRESLDQAEERIRYLESDGHRSAILEGSRSAIIEEFRHSPLGKVEVALACKAGSDYMVRQLPAEFRDLSGRLRYPPSVADQIDLLSRFEKAGAGYNAGEDDAEEEGRETESSSDDSPSVADPAAGESSGSKRDEVRKRSP